LRQVLARSLLKNRRVKGRILHVDDDPDIRLMISASLQKFGYAVATAGTNAEALELRSNSNLTFRVRLPDGSGSLSENQTAPANRAAVYYSAYGTNEGTGGCLGRVRPANNAAANAPRRTKDVAQR
jgi:hypothetical protein